MSRTLLVVLLLIGIGALGEAGAPHRAAILETILVDAREANTRVGPSRVTPLHLDAESGTTVRVRTVHRTFGVGGHVAIAASGDSLFVRMHNKDGVIPLAPSIDQCSDADTSGVWRCRIPFRFEGEGWLDIAATRGPSTLVGLDIIVVNAHRHPAVGLQSLIVFFAILSLVSLVFLVVRISVASKTAFLAAVGALWLVFTGGASGIALLAIVGGLYVLLHAQLSAPASRAHFACTIAVVVLILVLVKGRVTSWAVPFADPGGMGMAIPLGFAFFAVRAVDLSFRIATREIKAISAREYVGYMLFPATLSAGPIYTLTEFRHAALDRPSLVDWTAGLARIMVGLAKKVAGDILLVQAVGPNLMALYADPLHVPTGNLVTLLAAYTLYVYLDFSAYSDIAIGAGRQLGWRVPENFDYPLFRSSMRAFWRSWHITLSVLVSRWVYFFMAFPLRHSNRTARTVLPLVTTMLVIGLWHEMQATWFMWGLHHALGILLGDAAVRAIFPISTRAATTVLSRVVNAARYASGMLFVWTWVALSHVFTLVSDPMIALKVYRHALAGLVP